MKINQQFVEIQSAKECQTNATSCHETAKERTNNGIGYICPETQKVC
ncbi:hypothetical protein [Bacteroides sp.]